MSEPGSDPHASPPNRRAHDSENVEPREESWLSYEGATVPRFLAIVWAAFLIFTVVYLIRYVPSSWMEWFHE